MRAVVLYLKGVYQYQSQGDCTCMWRAVAFHFVFLSLLLVRRADSSDDASITAVWYGSMISESV